jgi:hypothetical protein
MPWKPMGSGGIAPPFLISALDGGEWLRPCRFTQGWRTPDTHWIGGWVDPRAGLDTVEREESCTAGNQTQAIQPVPIPCELSRLFMYMWSRLLFCCLPTHCLIMSSFKGRILLCLYSIFLIESVKTQHTCTFSFCNCKISVLQYCICT